MKPIEEFRQAMKTGRIQIGASIGFTDPLVTDALADSVDFLWIDVEHCAMSMEALAGHLLAARAKGKPALVRVTAAGTPFVKPVLDAGAEGIIVPQVRTVEEVRGAVDDCRYPPAGRRGFGPRVPSNYGRARPEALVQQANREILVAVQIETREAYEHLEEIARVPGLDSLVIGPWDLSAAFGVLGQMDHPRVVEAMDRIVTMGKAAGLFIGAGMGVSVELAAAMARRGVQWLQVGGDFSYLVWAMDRLSADIRRELGG